LRFLFNVMSFWVLGWAVIFGYNGFFKRALEWPPIVYVGKISYGIYLYHFFVPPLLLRVLSHFHF